MTDLRRALSEAVGAAFASADLPAELGRVTASDRPDLADFQCNGALAAAKSARRDPREIGAQVVAQLRENPVFKSVELAGLGFINLRVANGVLSERVREISADERAGGQPAETARRVMIDYGGPNVAKPMHVGHLRSSIIGESLKRIFRFRGDNVLGDAHFGDWGFQMGLLIVAVLDEQPAIAARIEPLLAEFRDEVAANVARWATARGQRATAVATSIAAAREHFESLTGESDVVLTGQDLCILADALQHFADDFFDEIIDAYDLAGDIDAEVEDDDLITPGGYSFNELANLGRKIGLAVDTLPG